MSLDKIVASGAVGSVRRGRDVCSRSAFVTGVTGVEAFVVGGISSSDASAAARKRSGGGFGFGWDSYKFIDATVASSRF